MNRILIVEDGITISRLIAVSLRRAGYDCTVANDGSTAADLIAEHKLSLRPEALVESKRRALADLRGEGRGPTVYPDVGRVLPQLASRFPLALCSAASLDTVDLLFVEGVAREWFTCVLSGEDVV